MGVVFGSWPESLHSEFEQVKRIEAGRKLKKKVVSFNPDEQTMVIAGSAADPYECDLQTCTCADFGIRHLPCKHIYCLADELGLRNTEKAADPSIPLPSLSDIALCMKLARSAPTHM